VVDGQTDDAPGTCDLVEAIENANDDAQTNVDCAAGEAGLDEIQLTVDVTLTTINNSDVDVEGDNGLPQITTPILIEGADHFIERTSADDFRIFFVDGDGDLTLNQTTVRDGLLQFDGLAVGGGILNQGTLTLTSSTVSGNTASSDPYAFAYGGGIMNLGTTTITDSTISGNVVRAIQSDSGSGFASGGGIANGFFYYGIIAPVLSITGSTISGNTTETYSPDFNAASYGGGVYAYRGSVSLTNSTVTGNSSISDGNNQARSYGAGITVAYANTTLTNTTVVGNDLQVSGAGTPYFNGAGVEGYFAPPMAIYMVNTILGYNTPDNCFSVSMSSDGGGNLADDTSCATIPDTLTLVDPILADNGGPTQTHALLTGSTAVDNGGACGLLVDQRGVARDDGTCDSGAYELVGCLAPDGDVVLLELDTLTEALVVEVCSTITAENDYQVGAGGDLTLRAGSHVIFGNGFSIIDTGVMTVEIDPGLQMPDSP
jgi:hypothetical protein